MSLTREMRKSLETSLNQSALDFLTGEFRKLEECLWKIKDLENRELYLLERIAEKDEMIWQLLQKHAGVSTPVGFQPQYYQYPYEGQSQTPGIYSQRGRGRGGRGGNQQQGGSQQGGGQGQGGGSNTPSSEYRKGGSYQYVPSIEPAERRYMPDELPEIEPVFERGEGETLEKPVVPFVRPALKPPSTRQPQR